MKKCRKGARGLVFVLAFSLVGAACAEDQYVSSSTAVSPSTATALTSDLSELSSAIGSLNYKLEVIQNRYLQLNKDIDQVRLANRDLRRAYAEDRLSLPDMEKFNGLQAELKLVRSDLAQVREDLSVLRSRMGEKKKAAPEEESTWYEKALRSPWLAVSSLGLSFLVLVTR